MKFFAAALIGIATLFCAPGANAQGLNVGMPLGSGCPTGYHWEMAQGFAQCIADPPPTPPTPPAPPASACKGDWKYGWGMDGGGTFIWIGFYNQSSGDSGGRPGMAVWYNDVQVYVDYNVPLPIDISNPDVYLTGLPYKMGEWIAGDTGNSNGTAWMVYAVCKR